MDAVIITHEHADHLHGIDELRSLSHFQGKTLPLFATEKLREHIKKSFSYIFTEGGNTGVSRPKLEFQEDLKASDSSWNELKVRGVPIEYISLPHGKTWSLGLIFAAEAAYIIDCHEIPAAALERLTQAKLKVLIIDCVRPHKHATHLTVEKALDYIEAIRPERAYLTHIGHELEHDKLIKMTKERFSFPVSPAYDGLEIFW